MKFVVVILSTLVICFVGANFVGSVPGGIWVDASWVESTQDFELQPMSQTTAQLVEIENDDEIRLEGRPFHSVYVQKIAFFSVASKPQTIFLDSWLRPPKHI